jgi:GNAT superfamily N-acetyltransferase
MAEKTKTLIRIAQKSDHSFIVESQLLMAEETENLKLNDETLRLGVTAVLDDAHKGQYYIAEVDGTPRAMLLTIPEWSDWRNGTVLWIHSVYVQKEYRKLGLFKSLYLHLKNKVSSSDNLRGLRLYVDKRNLNAQVVYKNLGMDNEHYELYEWLK